MTNTTPHPTDALPLPDEGWPAKFRCDSCDGNGEIGEPMYMGHFQPPERARCPYCDGRGWTSEESAYNSEHIRAARREGYELAREHESMRANVAAPTQAPQTKAEIAYRLRWLSKHMIDIAASIDYYGGMAEWAAHGVQMAGAAHIANQWADEIEQEITT